MGGGPNDGLARAAQVFAIDETATDSVVVPKIWSTKDRTTARM